MQRPSGIPRSGAIHRHLDYTLMRARFAGVIFVFQLKGLMGTLHIIAYITLCSAFGFSKKADIFTPTKRTFYFLINHIKTSYHTTSYHIIDEVSINS